MSDDTSTIQLRRGTAAQWAAANPVLALAEPGWETDTRRLKIGDGAATWSALPFASGALPMALVASLGSDGALFGAGFTQVPLSAVSIDTDGCWDPAGHVCVIKEPGLYAITTRLRWADQSPGGVNFVNGGGPNAADGPWCLWATTFGNRQGSVNSRYYQAAVGDRIQLYTYVDGGPLTLVSAEMSILRIR